MAEIRKLDTNAAARGYVVEVMRELLVRAEAGEFRSMHTCVIRADDGDMERHSAGDYNVHEVVGALETAKHSLIASNTRDPE